MIRLAKDDINAIFRSRNRDRWRKYLDVYDYLLSEMKNAHKLPDYERKFNYFYQVRRNAAWRREFYRLFYALRHKSRKDSFAHILKTLFKRTNKVEASFASKLAAILDPNLPIIDRHVLSYIGEKLPPAQREAGERIAHIIKLHARMGREFRAFLGTPPGKYLLKKFKSEHPERRISAMKALDFVLWLSGGRRK